MSTEGNNSYMFGGTRVEISVSSSGIGANKIYTTVIKIYGSDGKLLKTDIINHPILDNNILQELSFIPKNTVRVTTPLTVDNSEIPYDGISFLCCGCTKLEEFDFTTDLIHNTPRIGGSIKGNFAEYAFYGCESLKTLNIGDYFSCIDLNEPYNGAANNSVCCFAGCKNLETITGVFNFGDAPTYSDRADRTGWDDLKETAAGMFYGCDKLTGVQIHLTGDATAFMNDKVYEELGLKLNQFTLV